MKESKSITKAVMTAEWLSLAGSISFKSVAVIDFIGIDDHLNPKVHSHAIQFSQANAEPKYGV